jgi:toxin ParE1/3/4
VRHVIVHPAAAAEAVEAYEYYSAANPRAAERFAELLREAVSNIAEHAETYPCIDGELRRCLLPKYPYGVLYEIVDDETLFVLVLMHLKRRPGYWKGRR